MIEKTLFNYLSSKLSCPVVMERDGNTAPFVLIEKTGGSRQNKIGSATFAFQSYGKSLLEAAELNEQVINYILNMEELGNVSGSLNSEYNFTEQNTKDYRYQALFDIRYLMEE